MSKHEISKWASSREANHDDVRRVLLSGEHTSAGIADTLGVTVKSVNAAIKVLKKIGFNVQKFGERWTISKTLESGAGGLSMTSDGAGKYRFGVISDTHYGSKYAREDCTERLYDWFKRENVSRVYHCGNWIDGEKSFNKYDLIPEAHGMQAQLDYFVERYPRRRGIDTFMVAGDDHEGWYAQREGVDIGRMMENTAKNAGRTDLHYIGYMEAFVTLRNKKTGASAKMLVCHPGGGSAYATSYAIQKIAEAWQAGEKPGIALFGHLHKLEYLITRNVHCIQAGCTQDLTPFARKRRLSYHLGGWIVDAWQDQNGAVTECRTWLHQFFDRGYYNDQWSLSGPVSRR